MSVLDRVQEAWKMKAELNNDRIRLWRNIFWPILTFKLAGNEWWNIKTKTHAVWVNCILALMAHSFRKDSFQKKKPVNILHNQLKQSHNSGDTISNDFFFSYRQLLNFKRQVKKRIFKIDISILRDNHSHREQTCILNGHDGKSPLGSWWCKLVFTKTCFSPTGDYDYTNRSRLDLTRGFV